MVILVPRIVKLKMQDVNRSSFQVYWQLALIPCWTTEPRIWLAKIPLGWLIGPVERGEIDIPDLPPAAFRDLRVIRLKQKNPWSSFGPYPGQMAHHGNDCESINKSARKGQAWAASAFIIVLELPHLSWNFLVADASCISSLNSLIFFSERIRLKLLHYNGVERSLDVSRTPRPGCH